jgi:hypothetical protein
MNGSINDKPSSLLNILPLINVINIILNIANDIIDIVLYNSLLLIAIFVKYINIY